MDRLAAKMAILLLTVIGVNCVCELYSQSFCTDLPGFNSHQVFLDLSLEKMDATQEVMERFIFGAYHSVSSKYDLTPGCENALKRYLCHSTFPFCSSVGEKGKKLCNGFCDLLNETLTCPGMKEELQMLKKTAMSPQADLECGVVEWFGGEGSGEEEAEEEECLPPPDRLRAPPNAPLTEDSEFDNTTTTVVRGSTKEDVNDSLTAVFAVICVLTVAVVIALLLVIACWAYQRHQKKNKDIPQNLPRRPGALAKLGNDFGNLVDNPQYVVLIPQLSAFPQYSRSQIQYMKQLGQGNFGVVFQGSATGIEGEDKETVNCRRLKELHPRPRKFRNKANSLGTPRPQWKHRENKAVYGIQLGNERKTS